MPTGSRPPGRPRTSDISAATSTTVITPTGTLMKKMGRQPDPATSAAISSPPSSGPAAVETPAIAPYQPKA